jgi:nucleotide-binding universal stress UspA family protein
MTRVIAALDNSAAARPVLESATAVARALGAAVEPVYVRVDGDRVARGATDAAGLELRTLAGRPVERLVSAASEADVAFLVLGSRGRRTGVRPAGSTAMEVMTSLRKPVVVVPPDAEIRPALRRVLVPLEGTPATSSAQAGPIELAADADVEVVLLHVFDEESIPAFTDQPQHESAAWAHEFVARYCPRARGDVRLELRVGVPSECIARAVDELDVDLIALGWSQTLATGRAPVVRELLERARRPVLLVPLADEGGE